MQTKLLHLFTLILFFYISAISANASPVGAEEVSGQTATGGSTTCPLFFVTNRNLATKNETVKFGALRSGELLFGEYLRDDHTDNIKKSRLILFQSKQQFLEALKATGIRKMAVFVHGYRKSFNGSMDFGLKMARHLDVPLLVFAWPSRNNYCTYMADECTAEWSSQPLANVLHDLGQSIGYRNIAIVSHSLGARMVQWSLKDLYAKERPDDKFAAALFFSPDVDRDSFLQDAHFLKQSCSTCNVYLNKHDTRIWVSRLLHGSPRVGSRDKENAENKLAEFFHCDTSLPSHHIPFELVAARIHDIGAGQTNN